MRLLTSAWLTIFAGLATDCAQKTAFPYVSHVEESRAFFVAHKAEFAALVKAAEENGYTDVSYSVAKDRPPIVRVRKGDEVGRLAGADSARYAALFDGAEISRLWRTEGCYNVGVAHPDAEYDFAATFEAPCNVAPKRPDCQSLPTLPPRGTCEIGLQGKWRLVYFWRAPTSLTRAE